MNVNIDVIFKKLDCNNAKKEQQEGILLAMEIKHLSVFFQPIEGKNLWENCARIISSKNDIELKPYICKMFEWLQDMNGPGADIIYERLMLFPSVDIEDYYKVCLNLAKSNGDNAWYSSLNDFWNSKNSR